MGGFFKPWRRKVGLLTLLLVCVLLAGWVRSVGCRDVVRISPGWNWVFVFASIDQSLLEINGPHVSEGPDWPTINVYAAMSIDNSFKPVEEKQTWGGFGTFVQVATKRNYRTRVWFVPYWSVVIPLTLLSAWLLLSKPHKSTQKKSPEPIPAQGT